jgi:hypothetical protein
MARKPTHEELEQRVKGLEKESFKRKRAEEALREKTHLNQILLDAFPCEALLLRANREVVISNQPGRNVGAVPGKKCFATWGQRDDPCPHGAWHLPHCYYMLKPFDMNELKVLLDHISKKKGGANQWRN